MPRSEKDDVVFSKDIISYLPDALIDFILSFLADDLDAVVRTSVLSKSWRFCWTRVTKLVLDLQVLERNAKRTGLSVDSIIDSVLSRHSGSIHHFCIYADSGDSHVCRWYIERFSNFMSFSALTRLTLHCCDIGTSKSFGGFPNLLHLQLDTVIMVRTVAESIISGSPLLRNLELLKSSFEYEGDPVLINAPRLRFLSLNGRAKFCLKDYPILTSASITHVSNELSFHFKESLICHQRTCKVEQFVRTMPRVERVTLDNSVLFHLREGGFPMKLPTALLSLKDLEFSDLDSFRDIAGVFCLIRSSPNLESLTFHMDIWDEIADDDWKITIRCCEEQEDVGIMSSLSEVTFHQLLGTKYEMLLIKTILHCCPLLKTVNIIPSYYSTRQDEVWLFRELLDLQHPKSATMILKPRKVNEGKKLRICHLL